MKIVIMSSGVFHRPQRTKAGDEGYVAEIVLKASGKGLLRNGVYNITRTYTTQESAQIFHDEQMARMQESNTVVFLSFESDRIKRNFGIPTLIPSFPYRTHIQ